MYHLLNIVKLLILKCSFHVLFVIMISRVTNIAFKLNIKLHQCVYTDEVYKKSFTLAWSIILHSMVYCLVLSIFLLRTTLFCFNYYLSTYIKSPSWQGQHSQQSQRQIQPDDGLPTPPCPPKNDKSPLLVDIIGVTLGALSSLPMCLSLFFRCVGSLT